VYQARRYHDLDRALLAVAPTARTVTLPFAEVARLLGLPTPVSAYLLEQAFTRPETRQHWQRLGFAVTLDWIARQVVFTRLVDAAE
jgi:hypothetical protein